MTKTFIFKLVEHVEREVFVEADSWAAARALLEESGADDVRVTTFDIDAASYRRRVTRVRRWIAP